MRPYRMNQDTVSATAQFNFHLATSVRSLQPSRYGLSWSLLALPVVVMCIGFWSSPATAGDELLPPYNGATWQHLITPRSDSFGLGDEGSFYHVPDIPIDAANGAMFHNATAVTFAVALRGANVIDQIRIPFSVDETGHYSIRFHGSYAVRVVSLGGGLLHIADAASVFTQLKGGILDNGAPIAGGSHTIAEVDQVPNVFLDAVIWAAIEILDEPILAIRDYFDAAEPVYEKPETPYTLTFEAYLEVGEDYELSFDVESDCRSFSAGLFGGHSAIVHVAAQLARVEITPSHELSVRSLPDSGVSILLNPVDLNDVSDGVTPFNRAFYGNQQIELTSPATDNSGRSFLEWRINGLFYATPRSIILELDGDTIATAIYRPLDDILLVNGSLTPDSVNQNLARNTQAEFDVLVQNTGTVPIYVVATPQGEIAGWLSVPGTQTIGEDAAIVYRIGINVPSGAAFRQYTGQINFNSIALPILVTVAETSAGENEYPLGGSATVNGERATNVWFNTWTGPYWLDDCNQTSWEYGFALDAAFGAEFDRLRSWKYHVTVRKLDATSSNQKLCMRLTGELDECVSPTSIGAGYFGWEPDLYELARPGFNDIKISTNSYVACQGKDYWELSHFVDWWNSITFFKSAWGGEKTFSSSEYNDIQDGFDQCKLFAVVNSVPTEGRIRLYNNGKQVASREMRTSDSGQEVYWILSRSELERSNRFSLRGDKNDESIASFSSFKLYVKYFGGSPALAITKSLSPSVANIGDDVTVTIHIVNNGSNIADRVDLVDAALPVGINLVGGSLTHSFEDLDPGDNDSYSYTIRSDIAGQLVLGPAVVDYRSPGGDTFESTSNAVFVEVRGQLEVGAVWATEWSTVGTSLRVTSIVTAAGIGQPLGSAAVTGGIDKDFSGSWVYYDEFVLAYDPAKQEYSASSDRITTAGNYRAHILAQQPFYEDGLSSYWLFEVSCDDSVFCNGLEGPDANGICQAGSYPCPGQLCRESDDVCVDCLEHLDCNDSLFCNGTEICDENGICQPGSSRDCDDGVQCTDDSCDEDNDECSHAVNHGLCDNGQFCDGVERCDPIEDCQPGTPPCSDIAHCDEVRDVCVCTDDIECDDDLFCNGVETCDATGICQPGTVIDCNDGVNCTADTCNEDTDSCDNIPNGFICDNGLSCDGTETCDATLGCLPGIAIDCDDGVDCTVDMCNEGDGSCDHAPNDTLCDNGAWCDGVETCDPVQDCQIGTDRCPDIAHCDEVNKICICVTDDDCDDSIGCTEDTCADDKCVYTPIDSACNNNLFCDGVETCDAIADCQSGAAPCDDGLDCTEDTCDEGADMCQNDVLSGNCKINNTCYVDGTINPSTSCQSCQSSANELGWSPLQDGISCDDFNSCTSGDACTSGTCSGTQISGCPDPCAAVVCNDNNGCTIDSCSNGTCVFAPIDCDDEDFCTTDSCDPLDGSCNYEVVVCPEGETCDPVTGDCVIKPAEIPCTTASDCDDINLCTDDTCDPISGCVNTPQCMTGNDCTDGDSCTNDFCVNGCCQNVEVVCNSREECINGACIPVVITPPVAPTGVRATDGMFNDKIRIQWNGVPEASEYRVYRCTDDTSTESCFIKSPWQNSRIYDDISVIAGEVIWYRVKARNNNGESSYSSADMGHKDSSVIVDPPPTSPICGAFGPGMILSFFGLLCLRFVSSGRRIRSRR